MICYPVTQGSEQWDELRRGKATASQFGRIVTPAKLQLSTQAKAYACELVAQRIRVASPEPPPSYWMEWGTENEPNAKEEFTEETGLEIQEIGFVEPFDGAQFGCSPDGFVGENELIEIKCPKPETLIAWHAAGGVPPEHVLQIQGQLWICQKEVCHFYAWHPELSPYHFAIGRDERVIAALSKAMDQFLLMVDGIQAKVSARSPFGVDFSGVV